MEEGEIEVDSIELIVFRTLPPNWRESRVSLGWSISLKSQTMVEAGTFTWCASLFAPQGKRQP